MAARSTVAKPAPAVPTATLRDTTTLVADGQHNAFTDLIAWGGAYYLAYRQAHNHGTSPPGCLVVLRSATGEHWTPVATLATGGDDRDPRFFVTMEGVLGLLFGTWYPAWAPSTTISNAQQHLLSHLSLSTDGTHWSTPCQIGRPNYWFWSLRASEDVYLAAAYHFGGYNDRQHSVHLLASADLASWRERSCLLTGTEVSEPVLYAPLGGGLACLVRQDDGPPLHLSTDDPLRRAPWPFTVLGDLEYHPSAALPWRDGVIVAARALLPAPEPRLGARATRDLPQLKPRQARTVLLWLHAGRLTPLLGLPSRGDCAYAGLAWGPATPEGATLLVSYYSQHARPTRRAST